MTINQNPWIIPTWPAPKRVKALTTLRTGGFSQGPYESFNLAAHVGDDPEAVLKNRAFLKKALNLPQEPAWLTQVHGTQVLDLDLEYDDLSSQTNIPPEADASIARTRGLISAVLTADCLPILLCDTEGTEVAAIHAGWRGLANGVIEATVLKLRAKEGKKEGKAQKAFMAWLGPAIGPKAFIVGEEVKQAFSKPGDETAFLPYLNSSFSSSTDPSTEVLPSAAQWTVDLYELARFRLRALNITQIYGGNFCTYYETDQFYSYRRSNPTGRMATLIWME